MKKIILLILLVLLLIVTTVWWVTLIPYRSYFQLINGDISSSYITLKSSYAKRLWEPHHYYDFKSEEQQVRKKFWKEFTIQGVRIPLPVYHPYLRPAPYIITKSDGRLLRRPLFGLKIVKGLGQGKFKEYVKYEFYGEQPFERHLRDFKLFRLPVVKKYLLAKSEAEIWQDLFILDLRIANDSSFKWSHVEKYLQYSYLDLAYRSYIFYLRNLYFSKYALGFEFNPHSQMGRILLGQSTTLIKEIYYKLKEGKLYLFALSSRKNERAVAFFREEFFNHLHLVSKDEQEQEEIALSFKNIPRKERLSPLGYAYLYSDLTRQPVEQEKEFLRNMIQFIERDEQAYYFLAPLYQYALERYKRTFSLSSKFVDQDEELKLRRNIDLEIAREMEQLKKQKIKQPEKEFKSDKEQMEFFLNSVKGNFEEVEDEMSL